MTISNVKKKAEEEKMYGETIEAMESAKPEFMSTALYAMAILSDAQELLPPPQHLGQIRTAHQFINKAKYFLAREVEGEQR